MKNRQTMCFFRLKEPIKNCDLSKNIKYKY